MATRQALHLTRQRDDFPETVWDSKRCVAAVVVAAAIMAGPRATRRLIARLHEAELGGGRALLRHSRRELVLGHELTIRGIAYLQDCIMRARGGPLRGTFDDEFTIMVRAAGFSTRAVEGSNLPRSLASLKPHEFLALRYNPSRIGIGHAVLVGRDSSGQLYVYNSAKAGGFDRSPAKLEALCEKRKARAKADIVFWFNPDKRPDEVDRFSRLPSAHRGLRG